MSTQSSVSKFPSRWFDSLAVILLFAALLTAASQLIATNWVDDLYVSWTLVFIGVFIGVLLGYSHFQPITVGLLTVLYGLFFVPWQLGLTLEVDLLWRERLIEMLYRYQLTFTQLNDGENVTSSLLFLTIVSILAWVLSVYTAYSLVRYGNAWKAIIPGALVMIIVATYGVKHGTNTFLLGVFFFIALLLVARLSYLRRQLRLKDDRTILPSDLGYQMGKVIIFSTVSIILIAWSLPALGSKLPSFAKTWKSITEPLADIRTNVGKAFAPIDSPYGIVDVELINEYYGDTLSLGHGNILSDDEIMEIEAVKPPSEMPRYYWRARHYEKYEDRKWVGSSTQTIIPSEGALNQYEYDSRWETEVKITPKLRIATLLSPPGPISVSIPSEARVVENSDGSVDIVSFHPTPVLKPGEQYTVKGSPASATVAELRAAGTDYPEWVKERYLQVPDTVTPRTIALAQAITSGYENPYDAAAAITRYLRANIKYTEFLTEIPIEHDPIDWFLFIKQEGFCNYYASAEVIMLRSLGIPARLAVGYAQGELVYDTSALDGGDQGNIAGISNTNQYKVRQKDAHAWPEVYFPGIGWVEFEPTAGQAPLLRPRGLDPQNEALDNQPEENGQPLLDENEPILDDDFRVLPDQPETAAEPSRSIDIPWDLIAVVFLSIFLIILIRMDPVKNLPPLPVILEKGFLRIGLTPPEFIRKMAIRSMLPPEMNAYEELNRALMRLGTFPKPTSTPAERAVTLTSILPASKDPGEIVVNAYHKFTYSMHGSDSQNAVRAARIIRRLSYGEWFQRFLSQVRLRKKRP